MVSQSTQNYSSLKKSTWPHLLLVGQLGQTGSNLVKLIKNLYYLVRVITEPVHLSCSEGLVSVNSRSSSI